MKGHRYSLEPLFEVMGMTPHAACTALGLSGTTEMLYRRDGVTEKVADRLAVKAGVHPYTLWPEMAEHALVEIKKACAECGSLFVPKQQRSRFCSSLCRRRVASREYARRRYATDPEYRRRQIEARKERAKNEGAAMRRRTAPVKAAWFQANKERVYARRRARYAAKKQEVSTC